MNKINFQLSMDISLKRIFQSSFLTAVLMLPYWGTLFHLFEDHVHETCDISETHLHEIELDCNILEYQFASTTEVSSENNCNVILSFNQSKTSFFYLGYSYLINTIDTLRGPPSV